MSRTLKSFFHAAALAQVALVMAAGCNSNGDGGTGPVDDGTRTVGSTPPPVGSVPTGPVDAGTFTIASPKPKFQTKSGTQLYNSVKACMGDGMLLITADMLQTTSGAANPNAILPSSFAVSTLEGKDDIVTIQRAAFDGDAADLRQGTRADSLLLPYVTAQRNMANVVGRSCANGKNAALCECATPEASKAMLARCVPQLDPASPEFAAARAALQIKCLSKKSDAIASLLASAAISKLP